MGTFCNGGRQRLPVQMEHLPPLPLEAPAEGEGFAARVRARQKGPLVEPLAQCLRLHGDAVAHVLAEPLCRRVGGVGVEPHAVTVEPADPRPVRLVVSVVVAPPAPGPLVLLGLAALGARQVRPAGRQGGPEQFDEPLGRLGSRLVLSLGCGGLPERAPCPVPEAEALGVHEGAERTAEDEQPEAGRQAGDELGRAAMGPRPRRG
ncbi:MAG: hypothetical protein ACRDKW_18530 [Actinomycetota bacterium]